MPITDKSRDSLVEAGVVRLPHLDPSYANFTHPHHLLTIYGFSYKRSFGLCARSHSPYLFLVEYTCKRVFMWVYIEETQISRKTA